MNEEVKAYDIFISHSHHDEKLSHQIKKLLEAEGYKCWIPPDCIEPSMIWAEAIQKGISSSKVFLLIYSGHSNLSNQVWREITLAVSNQLYIISYKCEDVPLSEVMNYVKIKNNNSIYEGVTLEDGVFVGTNESFINDLRPRAIKKEMDFLSALETGN